MFCVFLQKRQVEIKEVRLKRAIESEDKTAKKGWSVALE